MNTNKRIFAKSKYVFALRQSTESSSCLTAFFSFLSSAAPPRLRVLQLLLIVRIDFILSYPQKKVNVFPRDKSGFPDFSEKPPAFFIYDFIICQAQIALPTDFRRHGILRIFRKFHVYFPLQRQIFRRTAHIHFEPTVFHMPFIQRRAVISKA